MLLLDRLEEEADRLAGAFAHHPADAVQIETFELAWAAAELRAARAGLTATTPLAAELAALFAGEAAESAISRLEVVARWRAWRSPRCG